MEIEKEFKVRFFLKMHNQNKNYESAIMLQIKVGDTFIKKSLKKYVHEQFWNDKKECVIKSAENSAELNYFLFFVKARIHRIYDEMIENNAEMSASCVFEHYLLECTSSELWTEKDLATGEILNLVPPKNNYLELYEFDKILNAEIIDENTDIVRDAFVFSCLAGLDIVWHLKELTVDDIYIFKGRKWIFLKERSILVSVTDALNRIIEKYDEHPLRLSKRKLIPLPNQKTMDAVRKTLPSLCNISKKLNGTVASRTYEVYTREELHNLLFLFPARNKSMALKHYYDSEHQNMIFRMEKMNFIIKNKHLII